LRISTEIEIVGLTEPVVSVTLHFFLRQARGLVPAIGQFYDNADITAINLQYLHHMTI